MATLSAHEMTPSSSSSTSTSTPSVPVDVDAAASAAAAALKSSFLSIHRILRRGDLVWFRGRPQKTKSGELSLVPKEAKLMAPCWREIPMKLTEPVRRKRSQHTTNTHTPHTHHTTGQKDDTRHAISLACAEAVFFCSLWYLSRILVIVIVTWTCS